MVCWLERRTRDRRVASSNPGRSSGKILFSRVNFVWCPFHPRVTAVARKRPRSFCQKCREQITHKHAHILDPTKSERADHAAVQALWWNLSGNELTRNSSGNTWSQLSQPAEPLWSDPGIKSRISSRELISTLKKKSQAGNKWSNILPKSSQARKKPPPRRLPSTSSHN